MVDAWVKSGDTLSSNASSAYEIFNDATEAELWNMANTGPVRELSKGFAARAVRSIMDQKWPRRSQGLSNDLISKRSPADATLVIWQGAPNV